MAGTAAIVCGLLWARTLATGYVVAAALIGLLALALFRLAARGLGARALCGAGLALLALGLAFAVWTGLRVHDVSAHWAAFSAQRETRLRSRLDREMSATLRRGNRVAAQAAAEAARAGPENVDAEFRYLETLRQHSGVAAIAIFDGAGELLAWSGEHRGPLPQDVTLGTAPVLYADRPLFSYLYVVQPVRDRGGSAVAMILLQTGPPLGSVPGSGLAERFSRETGSSVRFAAGPDSAADWIYRQGGTAALHATIQPLTQSEARAQVTRFGQRLTVAALALAFLLLMAGWVRAADEDARTATLPLAGAVVFLAAAPLSAVLPLGRLFSPGLLLLPTPGDVTLGSLLAVLLPVSALIVAWHQVPLGRRLFVVAVALGAAAIVLGYASGLELLFSGATSTLLERGPYLWWGLQLAAVLLLASLTGMVLPRMSAPAESERSARGASGPRWLFVAAALVLSTVLAMLAVARWQASPAPPSETRHRLWLTALLWGAPFVLLAIGLRRRPERGGRLLRTLCAGWLAASFVLPHLWVAHLGARLGDAERSLAKLGTQADPYATYLLTRFGDSVEHADQRSEGDLDLLFRSWVASGLANEGNPIQLTLWDSAGAPRLELHLAGAPSPSPRSAAATSVLRDMLSRARVQGRPVLVSQPPQLNANEALAVPLPDGRGVTAVVPPRRTLELTPALMSVLGAPPSSGSELALVPAGATPPAGRPGLVRWEQTDQGWRSSAWVRYPEGVYNAHLELRIPSIGVQAARGVLIVAVDLALLSVLWLLARAAEGAWKRPAAGWLGWLGSFRARITLALFTFFLIPTAVFGAFAYRALAGEATRSAHVLGEHAAGEAARAFPASTYLDSLANRVGEEVLYYFRGELSEASSREARQLGLYGAWMPAPVYLSLEGGENVTASQTLHISSRPYVMSFRSLGQDGALAVPVSLAAGDAVVRQEELTHLILFAVLLGGVLSLVLSLYVARALARPIGQIRRAAAAVGAGHLDVRLPEEHADEFGELFTSFNRMVRRLRRARSREVRTARVLAWGEMARQVAHEIKNPLTPIRLSVQHLRRAYADRRPDFEAILDTNVKHVLAEIDRLTEIARAFSRYGLPPESVGPAEAVDVAGVVRETLTLYRSGDRVTEYVQDLAGDLPSGVARTGELKEVLVNLLENARAAVGEDGEGARIRVSARVVDDAIEVDVSDNGPGIAPDLLPRIFEPRFSTRTSGTGLGLAIVRRLVESWGGNVRVESSVGRGTTVRVRMQVAGDVPSGDG